MIAQLCEFVSRNVWALLIDLILTFLMFYPLMTFVRFGWARRAAEICESLDDKAKQQYLANYHKQSYSLPMAEQAFLKFYVDRYGLKYSVLPLLLLLVIAGFSNFFLAESLQDLVKPEAIPSKFPPSAAAIAGAYTFICWDFFSRMQRLTLSRADILRAALRLLIAMPVGFAFATLLKEDLAPFVAFAMAAFPVQLIGTILQRQMKTRLNLELTSQAARDQVFLLSGIDTPIAERIEDADVTTITQLAWEDPVQLTMRTNLQFAFVIDIIGQALAWVYFEDKLKPMGVIGLHGAVEIRQLGRDLGLMEETGSTVRGPAPERPVSLESHQVIRRADEIEVTDSIVEFEPSRADALPPGPSETRRVAEAVLKAAAEIAKVDPQALKYTIGQIGEDPTAEFLEVCWGSLTSAR
jgi:hypothetical protein